MDQQAKLQELEVLRARVRQLEEELGKPITEPPEPESPRNWPPRDFYATYFVLAGFVLGIFGAVSSLLFNVIGSLAIGQHPLQLIKVYLTFPLGEAALSDKVDSGLALAFGCVLYLLTGMVLGIPFHVILNRWFANASFVLRFCVVTVLSLALWLINFYLILSWLQPALFGGNWILAEIPPWVAAATHLVFGWTMLLVQPLGKFVVATDSIAEAS